MSLAGPFLFDPRAFWGDENVRLMSGEQVAAYIKILSLQWENGSVPADARRLACLMSDGARSYSEKDLTGREPFRKAGEPAEGSLEAPLEGSLWGNLQPCFREAEGRLTNDRLAEERVVWVEKKARMSAGGKKGGRRSAKTRAKGVTDRKPPSSPPSSPPSKPPSSQGSPSYTSSSSDSDTTSKEEKNPQKGSCPATVQGDRTRPPPESAAPFWFPVKRGAKALPWDARENGQGVRMPIYPEKVAEWSKAFGGADVTPEIRKCYQWNMDNPGRQKTPTGLHKHIGAWLARANDDGKLGGSDGSTRPWKGRSLPAGPDSDGESRGIDH